MDEQSGRQSERPRVSVVYGVRAIGAMRNLACPMLLLLACGSTEIESSPGWSIRGWNADLRSGLGRAPPLDRIMLTNGRLYVQQAARRVELRGRVHPCANERPPWSRRRRGVSDFNALHSGKHNEKVQLCAYLDAPPRLTGPIASPDHVSRERRGRALTEAVDLFPLRTKPIQRNGPGRVWRRSSGS